MKNDLLLVVVIQLLSSLTKSNSTEIGLFRISCHILFHYFSRTLLQFFFYNISINPKNVECSLSNLDKICRFSVINRKQFSTIQLVKMLINFDKANKMKVNRLIKARSYSLSFACSFCMDRSQLFRIL